VTEAIMDLFRQYAERKKQELMEKAAEKLGGKVEDGKVVLPGNAMDREYGGSPYISQTLGNVGIKPR